MEDIRHGDNLALLGALADGCVQMVYADPPFNTGRTQTRQTLATAAAESGDRTGFGGRRYATTMLATSIVVAYRRPPKPVRSPLSAAAVASVWRVCVRPVLNGG